MNKNELIALANKGVIKIGGNNAEIIIRDSAGNNGDWVEIFIQPINEYTELAMLGGKWLEYVTDEECQELEKGIQKIYDKMAAQVEICKREPLKLATVNSDRTLLISENDKIYKIFQEKEYFRVVALYNGEADYPINKPIEIENKIYTPVWSFWLDSGCYKGKY